MNLLALRQSLIKHEGIRSLPYEDTEENLTIGVGHLLTKPISQAAISQILSDDIEEAIDELNRAFPRWMAHNDVRQNVLLELMFNLGCQRLGGFKLMWAALEKKDYIEAAKQMLDSRWSRQTKGRAKTLAKMMETGEA